MKVNIRTCVHFNSLFVGLLLGGVVSLLPACSARADVIDIEWGLIAAFGSGEAAIQVGDEVRWHWADALSHSVTHDASSPEFDSGVVTGMGFTFTHQFNLAGVYPYFDLVNPSLLDGTITVNPVPEPVMGWMAATGLLLALVRRRLGG